MEWQPTPLFRKQSPVGMRGRMSKLEEEKRMRKLLAMTVAATTLLAACG
jgi:hypothetical protein